MTTDHSYEEYDQWKKLYLCHENELCSTDSKIHNRIVDLAENLIWRKLEEQCAKEQ